jgi:hypothetical protein
VGLASSRERRDLRAARVELRRGSTDSGADDDDVDELRLWRGRVGERWSLGRKRARVGEDLGVQFIEEGEGERDVGEEKKRRPAIQAVIKGIHHRRD